MSRRSGYNIIITNSTFGEIFTLKLGLKRLITLLLLLLIAPVALVVVLLIAPRIYRNADEVTVLEEKNRTLQATVDSIDVIKRNIITIDRNSRYLRSVAELKGATPLPALSEFLQSDSLKRTLTAGPKIQTTLHTPSLRPVLGGVVSRGYSKGAHEALDISAGKGTTIRAAADGVVKKVYFDEFLGNVIVLSHGEEYTTLYAHCETVIAQLSAVVKRGSPIATVGSTGKESTGPHLHYEVRNSEGVVINPESLFN